MWCAMLNVVVLQAAQRQRRRKKRRTRAADSFCTGTFDDLYYITSELLGEGAYASVWTCVNKYTNLECAVKVVTQLMFVCLYGKAANWVLWTLLRDE